MKDTTQNEAPLSDLLVDALNVQGYNAGQLRTRHRSRIPANNHTPRALSARSGQIPWEALDAEHSVGHGCGGLLEAVLARIQIADSVLGSSAISRTHVLEAIALARVPSIDALDGDTNITADLGYFCGTQRCVETSASDVVFYAPYLGSNGRPHIGSYQRVVFRRFVLKRPALPTTKVTLVLRVLIERLQVLSAYYGEASRKLPGTLRACSADQRWWFDPETGNGHAFVVDAKSEQRIVMRSRRDDCPW